MSWLARSIANSLNFDEDDVNAATNPGHNRPESPESSDDATSPTSPSRGVKEDLSEISNTLTRQFWGVASFLAPPPQADSKSPASESDQGSILGIRSDFAEIGGKFRTGISRLSTNINVSEITKLASNLLQLESDDEDEGSSRRQSFDSPVEGVAGVTEDVVSFARDISLYPHTWLDFPLPENVDFDMTDAQQEHALAVERLSPRLAALRIELCPGYMPESCFWMIYFVLLHPRLDKPDAELLSTPQVMKARALLGSELKNQSTTDQEVSVKQSLDLEEVDISRHEEPLSIPYVISENEPKTEVVDNPIVGRSETQTGDKLVSEDKAVDQVTEHELKDQNIAKTDEISGKQSSDLEEIDISHHEEVSLSVISENEPDEPSATHEIVSETKTAENPVSEEKVVDKVKDQYQKSVSVSVSNEDDGDDWLEEETPEVGGKSIPIGNDDDVSFSDLEDDD